MSAEIIPFPSRCAGAPVARLEPWLTKRQLAAHLGVSCSWVERRMRLGLPHHRDPMYGRVLRFRASDVEAWMGAQR